MKLKNLITNIHLSIMQLKLNYKYLIRVYITLYKTTFKYLTAVRGQNGVFIN